MIIGRFLYDRTADAYSGKLITLTVQNQFVVLRPSGRPGKNEPDYRVSADTMIGPIEIGAAWKCTSKRDGDFLSVTLDDPAFAKPIKASMFLGDDDTANLIWVRA